MIINPKQLLQILVNQKIITQEQANIIEVEILKKNIPIDDYLLHYSKINKEDILKAIASIYNVPYVNIAEVAIDQQALGYISEIIAKKNNILPYRYDIQNNTVYVATSDPFDFNLLDFLEKKINKKIIPVLADSADIEKILNSSYSQNLNPEVKEALKEINHHFVSHSSDDEKETVIKVAPIAKIVNTILEFAVKSRTSDIHIEPEENRTRVRYRIDGILNEKLSLPKGIHDSLVSRIKIMAEMKIDERRIPQDGRFNFKLGEEEVDLRISTLPTVHGEKIVMRLLKKTGGLPSLLELGLRGNQLRDLENAYSKPYGIILVTGPTGSGKTTTLYSVLSRLNKPGVNIVTLEDPVEYQIEGINQVQINPQAGLTFATGLRAFLRQDPNIILVGEIRDKETTMLAIQAALTGHLVFATLHTNDAPTAIPRLIDLGAEPFLISSVLNASLAQRIVRRVCNYCKETYEPLPEIQEKIKTVLGGFLPQSIVQNQSPIRLSRGKGCEECNNTGYHGRIAIFEVMNVTTAINKLIIKQASALEIKNLAQSEGMITMKQDGFLKALDGITTLEEVYRVAET
jgi:type II secretory ATPase GspE/PulE/Tfp pilus assembly ATPase PilB-like protein